MLRALKPFIICLFWSSFTTSQNVHEDPSLLVFNKAKIIIDTTRTGRVNGWRNYCSISRVFRKIQIWVHTVHNNNTFT